MLLSRVRSLEAVMSPGLNDLLKKPFALSQFIPYPILTVPSNCAYRC